MKSKKSGTKLKKSKIMKEVEQFYGDHIDPEKMNIQEFNSCVKYGVNENYESCVNKIDHVIAASKDDEVIAADLLCFIYNDLPEIQKMPILYWFLENYGFDVDCADYEDLICNYLDNESRRAKKIRLAEAKEALESFMGKDGKIEIRANSDDKDNVFFEVSSRGDYARDVDLDDILYVYMDNDYTFQVFAVPEFLKQAD